jgi:muramoyltetrapeptide carboxypeptidase
VKAPRLRPGDAVGIVSPSWPGAALFPHRVENGVKQLERMGFRVVLGRHALSQRDYVSESAENRVADLHELFEDPEVRAIVAAIGGDHCAHLLPHLDFDRLAKHPTILMGYSDVTVLNVAVWRTTGLVTFNGPALLTDFAEHPRIFEYTESSFLHITGRAEPVGCVQPADFWTDEILDWSQKLDLERPRQRQPSPGWSWLQPGRAEGVLVGGCLESLQHLRGTPYWPDLEGSILFLETSEEKPSPATVDGLLMDYENMGALERLAGLLFARPMGYSEDEKQELRQVIVERTRRHGFPVVADMDFGHTEPRFVLPVGCRARIDSEARAFEILEAAVA